ncbi:lipoyl synthase, partial [Salmonella enterica subsp. enterica serovar Cerro]|nr:lipoyl synthase [Salmonella enterica subsp. enterica serovar Cerro]
MASPVGTNVVAPGASSTASSRQARRSSPASIVMERGVKYRDADKMALIPVKNVVTERDALLRKPEWMKIKLP